MNILNLIARKRDGHSLSDSEIQFLIEGVQRDAIPDYQIAAWLMAVYLRGMTHAETRALTLAMAQSKTVLDLSDVKRALGVSLIADKHSTGGVGDKTTITVLPLVAACGVPIGKLSGRGLGHTGGTLDKLESIPGFTVDLTIERFKSILTHVGLALAGQTPDLAPADGRLYALRDVTATVASMPLIASSIMSKKIAAGADAVVLDVKVGRGAFMQTEPAAVELARVMVEIGSALGRRVSAVIADMNQPLGRTVGNALEVREAMLALLPRTASGVAATEHWVGDDFREHCHSVASEMLRLVGRVSTEVEARQLLEDTIDSGRARAKLREWVEAQGGDARVVDDPSRLPSARYIEDVPAPRSGYIAALDALAVGLSAMRLGAGRQKKGEPVDRAVGVVLHKKIGEGVAAGDRLLTVYANDRAKLDAERETLLDAYDWSAEPVSLPAHTHTVIQAPASERRVSPDNARPLDDHPLHDA
ncbi:MAG: thymidine phosphorylase [Chloroflexi bacterium]|nr:thymidine phosphorylase [Chloroflexota bacterium]